MSATTMNLTMVKHLILKDWYFVRGPILGYLAAAAVGVGLVAVGSEQAFLAGSILLITILIAVGMHLPLATIVEERKAQTLPFVLSLPVSPREYIAAKILANLLIVLVPWLAIAGGSLAVAAARTGVQGGVIPFWVVVLTELLAASCLFITVAIATESLAWTVAVTVVSNLFFQAFLYTVSHIPSVAAEIKGPKAVWNRALICILLVEVAIIALLIAAAFYFPSRKKDLL